MRRKEEGEGQERRWRRRWWKKQRSWGHLPVKYGSVTVVSKLRP
jgi:hypothetical protein